MTISLTRLRRAVFLLLLGFFSGCSGLPFAATPAATHCEASRSERHASTLDSATGRPPTASDAATPSSSFAESAADTCLATAREMEAHADHLAAVEQYERARDLEPDRPGIRAHLATLYERLGDRKRAAAEYEAALEEDAKSAELWNDYAYFQFQGGEIDEAETSARKAIKLDPEHKRSWVNLGVILAEQARYDEAYEAFAHAVPPAAAHNNLGIILARQGRIDDARRELAEAHRLDPTLRQPPSVLQQLSEEFVRLTQEETPQQDAPHAKSIAVAHAAKGPRAVAQNSAPIFVNDSPAEDDLHVHAATKSPTRDASRVLRR